MGQTYKYLEFAQSKGSHHSQVKEQLKETLISKPKFILETIKKKQSVQ